jgi:hypothetical protein
MVAVSSTICGASKWARTDSKTASGTAAGVIRPWRLGTRPGRSLAHPIFAPECDKDVLDDPDKCPPCTKTEECGTPCDNEQCELCPGSPTRICTPSAVAERMPAQLCVLETSDDCLIGEFCTQDCCIPQVD